MKEQFSEKLSLNKANRERLEVINKIIIEYTTQGYRLTLRQLYYQLVSRDIIPNNKKEYAKLSGLLVKGRMFGIVDWYAIEDRTRQPYIPYSVDDIEDAIQDTIDQYRLDRMSNQDVYIEVWVEKDALSGVLKRITSKYHITLVVNKGYGSASSMYDASKRIKNAISNGKVCHILYLGDFDPSGMNMVDDIRNRFREFDADVVVKRIALTREQISKYNPPPNFAKMTDPRAKSYVAEFGDKSWEVDALNPKILNQLLTDEIEQLIDIELYQEILDKEKDDVEKLKQFQEQSNEN
jgi:hypothetical protein